MLPKYTSLDTYLISSSLLSFINLKLVNIKPLNLS